MDKLAYLNNKDITEPHLNFDELLEKNEGVSVFSGTIYGLFGKLFDKGKFSEVNDLYSKLKLN